MVFATLGPTLRERLVSFLPTHLWLLGISWLALAHGAYAQTTGSAHFTSSQRELPIIAQNPEGMAVDQDGNIFVVDQVPGTITEDSLSADAYSSNVVLTGLKSPTAIAVDVQGNLYVTEDARYQNGPTDVVKESVASKNSAKTYTATVIPTTGLGLPAGIALDQSGAIYVADSLNNRIIKLTPSKSGYEQSVFPTSALLQPAGVAVDADGSVYIADAGHGRVLKEAPSGNGYTESVVTSKEFSLDFNALQVAADGLHNIYVLADQGDAGALVFKETPDGPTYTESSFMIARIQSPSAIAADRRGFFYAVGPGTNQLTKVSLGLGDAGPANLYTDSLPISLVFTSDTDGATVGSVAASSQESTNTIRFTDAGTGSCNFYGGYIDLAGESCSVDVIFRPNSPGILSGIVTINDPAGNALASGYLYGSGLAPNVQFPLTETNLYGVYAHPTGGATDVNLNFFFTESGTGTVWVASPGYHDVTEINAVATGLDNPTGVAVGPDGGVYVAASNAIFKEQWSQSTYSSDQIEVLSGLDHLAGIAVDGSANLYLIASSGGDARKEIPLSHGGYREMTLGSGIRNPSGIAADTPGNVYITDAQHGVLYKETIQANGSYQQSVVATGLDAPEGVAIDEVGNIYVALAGAGAIYQFLPQADGSYRQTVEATDVPNAWGVGVDEYGDIYITQNTGDGSLVIANVWTPPNLMFANTRVGTISADSPKAVTLKNGGNAPLIFEDADLGANPLVPAGFTLSNESTCLMLNGVLQPGESCTYAFDFVPQARIAYAGNATISDNDYDLYYPYFTQQIIPLSGLGVTADTTRTTMRITPDPVKAGLGVSMAIKVTDTSVPSAALTGDVTVNDTVGSATTTLNGGSPITLNQGKATLTTTFSSPGTHTITAHYNGVAGSFSGSTFSLTLTIKP